MRNLEDLGRIATLLCRGGLAAGKTVDQVMCAIMVGMELGIGPATSIQGLYVVNGKVEAGINLLMALAQRSKEWRGYTVAWSGSLEKGDLAATVTLKREGREPVVQEMDLGRAREWGWLAQRGSTWNKDPRHMLETRALAWAIRKQFADEVRGLYSAGEISEQE